MPPKMVELLIPFESLIEAITHLSLADKRVLQDLLAEQIAQAEIESLVVQTEIREKRLAYQTQTIAPLDEHIEGLKHQVVSLLDALPETKLSVVVDFVQFLSEQERLNDWMSAQSQSAAYQEWIGSDNDIYDEVFADVYPTR